MQIWAESRDPVSPPSSPVPIPAAPFQVIYVSITYIIRPRDLSTKGEVIGTEKVEQGGMEPGAVVRQTSCARTEMREKCGEAVEVNLTRFSVVVHRASAGRRLSDPSVLVILPRSFS